MKNILTATLLLIAIHFTVVPAIADMYKWVDKNGVIHFSDTPPKSERNVETLETSNYKEPPPKPAVSEAESGPAPTPEEKVKKESVNHGHKVEIFTTSWCRYCKDAIAFLRSNRIEFQQYDIEKDRQAAERMRSLGGRGGVPFAVINGKKIYGFSTATYKSVLGLR